MCLFVFRRRSPARLIVCLIGGLGWCLIGSAAYSNTLVMMWIGLGLSGASLLLGVILCIVLRRDCRVFQPNLCKFGDDFPSERSQLVDNLPSVIIDTSPFNNGFSHVTDSTLVTPPPAYSGQYSKIQKSRDPKSVRVASHRHELFLTQSVDQHTHHALPWTCACSGYAACVCVSVRVTAVACPGVSL